ncbi:GyrI-like domain-containing protein [Phreatobacter aquaticus]|uniref:GyrI-like domain-containing protein n=1 Tax=Phreatobacter aquaticus TaxID=2570229 RepID=A0A4D7QKU4_9HYPH|nr:GyrI-like domain-containing protein [Phreatobacter aquaticus]QCK84932.1 GyrI-like domain-containing protein [Phreatobacter aquaticus]
MAAQAIVKAVRPILLGAALAWGLSSAPVLSQTPPAAPAPPAAAQPVPPPAAETPPAAATPPVASGDAVDTSGFGDEVTLTARPALVLKGKANWDDLYATFRKALADLNGIARAQGAVAAGPPMIRFVSSTDDTADFEAILPVAQITGATDRFLPAMPGMTPGGKAIRFTHLGGYDTMEQTYDEIANYIDERGVQAEDAFVEEYVRDPDTTAETELATFIYVFPKQ